VNVRGEKEGRRGTERRREEEEGGGKDNKTKEDKGRGGKVGKEGRISKHTPFPHLEGFLI
jgi:hypothetical protein